MTKPFWYAVAGVMGVGFWSWVAGSVVVGFAMTWWHDLTSSDAPRYQP
jgi:hypothetical protein